MTSTFKYNYYTKFSPVEDLMRGSHLCSLSLINRAVERGADINHKNGAALVNVIYADCSNKEKKEVVNYLLANGAQLQGESTLLSLSILNRNQDLIEFFLPKVSDFKKEGESLFYALQTHDHNLASILWKQGARLSEYALEDLYETGDTDAKALYSDLYNNDPGEL
jgi:hypothetical protein